MAAQLSITYTPRYQGCHRVCFRTTQQEYCCYLDTSGSTIGTPKTVDIFLDDYSDCLSFVPAEISCAGTTAITGYIQPCCADENSDDNRVTYTASFESTPCNPYSVECEESGIGIITINNAGYGWPIGVVPDIIVNTTGSGSGFTATAIMQCLPGDNFCSIDDIDITDPGEGYFYLNELSVEIDPLPSGVSNELILNQSFLLGFNDWIVTPIIDGWTLSVPANVPYYNIPVYSSSGGSLSQIILDPGKTYFIVFEKIKVRSVNGVARFIITAGTFSSTGTASNQYMITRNAGDPDFDSGFTTSLVCSGTSEFSIYGDSSTNDPGNTISFTRVSVREVGEAINPDLEVTYLDDCGTFTVPDCDGTANPTTYGILGTPQYSINVCSGGAGPVGAKYTITPNPTYGGLGPELLLNNTFETSVDDWTQDLSLTVSWSSNYGGSAQFGAADSVAGISQDVLTVGQEYTVDIDLTIIFDGDCTPELEAFTRFTIYAGTATYGPLNFSGSESFNFNITCTDNPTFRIEAWDPEGCTATDILTPQMYCSYVSVKEVGDPIPVSCCDCVLYNVIVRNPIDIYYTNCNQTIDTVSVESGAIGITVCAVRGSIWPVNKLDNVEILAITEVGDCIPTE